MHWKLKLASVLIMGALGMPALAQSTVPLQSDGSTRTPVINQRQRNQQHRIQQGVRSGELTPSETRHLEREQARIQHDKRQAKADGRVTPQERANLTHEQNRASRDIYRDKHNNRTRQN